MKRENGNMLLENDDKADIGGKNTWKYYTMEMNYKIHWKNKTSILEDERGSDYYITVWNSTEESEK